MKNYLSAAALAAVLLSLYSCGSSAEQIQATDTEAATGSESVTETAAETEEAFDDGLPTEDFGGREFRIWCNSSTAYETLATEETGDIENDSIYERNRRMEERFNIQVETLSQDMSSGEAYDALVKIVMAGDDACELASGEVWNFYKAMTKGIYQDWNTTKYIQQDKPWWNQSINDNATINGKLFGLVGYLSTTYLQNINTIYMNERLAAEFDINRDDLYQLVYDGKWTFDHLVETVKDVYRDVNGNSERDEDDIYGYVPENAVFVDGYPDAFEIPITSKNADGTISVTLVTDKAVEAFDKLHDFLYNTEGATCFDSSDDHTSKFVNGTVVFLHSYLYISFYDLRDMEDSYSLLPAPKYDEAQENYHDLVADGLTIWGLPMTVSDTDFVSLVTDAMCADTYEYVYPAYYDVAMKSKYSKDAETAKMVDLIVDAASFDFSFEYGVYLESLPYLFRYATEENSVGLATLYAKKEKNITKRLANVMAFYQ